MSVRLEEAGDAAPAAEVPSMTLGDYLARAGSALRTSLPKVWVEAVVHEAKAQGQGGLRVELVEPGNDARGEGRLNAFVNGRALASISETIGIPVDAATLKGTHVRMLIQTTFHARYHLQGKVLDLDPTMVQGLLEKRLEFIRWSLAERGLLGAQGWLAVPDDITDIAVIHPDRSAGWADVQSELERLQERGILRFTSYPTRFEGKGAASGIAEVLSRIGAGTLPDLVLIIRGGGAASGFAGLTDLVLARAVCLCPVPIVTGIGHAHDRSIIDELAWRAADTPSKALGVVKSILRRRCQQTSADHRAIVAAMDHRVRGTLQPLLTAMREGAVEAAEALTARQAARLRETIHKVERHVVVFRGKLDLTQADLDRLADTLLATAPGIPRTAAAGLTALYGGIAQSTRSRLPRPAGLVADVDRSAGAMVAFLDRQGAALRTTLTALENACRRRLSDENLRLAEKAAAAKALDLDATLRRGFVLPLDEQRHIIRSAQAAEAAKRIELLFVDGSVACQSTSY